MGELVLLLEHGDQVWYVARDSIGRPDVVVYAWVRPRVEATQAHDDEGDGHQAEDVIEGYIGIRRSLRSEGKNEKREEDGAERGAHDGGSARDAGSRQDRWRTEERKNREEP